MNTKLKLTTILMLGLASHGAFAAKGAMDVNRQFNLTASVNAEMAISEIKWDNDPWNDSSNKAINLTTTKTTGKDPKAVNFQGEQVIKIRSNYNMKVKNTGSHLVNIFTGSKEENCTDAAATKCRQMRIKWEKAGTNIANEISTAGIPAHDAEKKQDGSEIKKFEEQTLQSHKIVITPNLPNPTGVLETGQYRTSSPIMLTFVESV
jgi:hypothetical protein